MSYVDDNLLPSETVLYRTRRHWIVLVGPVAVAVFLVFLSIAMTFNSGMVGLGLLTLLVAAAVVFYGVLQRNSADMAVTNNRIIIKTGIVTHHSLEITFDKVESIGVDQGVLGRSLDYGNIIVRGTGGTPEVFGEIMEPMQFRRAVQSQMERGRPASVGKQPGMAINPDISQGEAHASLES
jgi:uncharacterized membrane protein YdbT with pleckstrin-like domain